MLPSTKAAFSCLHPSKGYLCHNETSQLWAIDIGQIRGLGGAWEGREAMKDSWATQCNSLCQATLQMPEYCWIEDPTQVIWGSQDWLGTMDERHVCPGTRQTTCIIQRALLNCYITSSPVSYTWLTAERCAVCMKLGQTYMHPECLIQDTIPGIYKQLCNCF